MSIILTTVAAWAPSSPAESGRSRETAADPSDASNRSNTSKKQHNLIARIFFLRSGKGRRSLQINGAAPPNSRQPIACAHGSEGRGVVFRAAASKSRPAFKSVTPICVSILRTSDGGCFPWSNGFHYDPDSSQYISDLILHALGFGLQEFL